MIERLKKLLLEKFEYELEDYALYEISRGKNKILPFTIALFAVSSVLLILNRTNIFVNFMNIGILIFLLIVLVIVPLAFQKGSKHEAIIVTPKYLIQRIAKKEYVIVEFDGVTGFKIEKDGIIIIENKSRIVLGTDLFREEIESIIEILEAKGKTFDAEKDFMIRPILIVIENNKVSIEDDEKVTTTEKLFKKYQKLYPMLTPGFVNEILFRNSMIEDVKISLKSLVLILNGFEVKGGHPENTKFENLSAIDGILIFESIVFQKAVLEDLNHDNPPKVLKLGLKGISQYLNKAVISEWKSNGNVMEMVFATGVHQLSTTFKYQEVIVGWKKAK